MTQYEVTRPESAPLRALYGNISKPITIDGKQVSFVEEGAGMAGLDGSDNKDWAGLTGHSLFAAGFATEISTLMREKGLDTNPRNVLNAHLASHTGRRKWDEANKYPDYVKNSAEITQSSNEEIGVKHVKSQGLKKEHTDIIEALAHGHDAPPDVYKSLDYRIASYCDHRCEHKIYSLSERMGKFLLGNFFNTKDMTVLAKMELEKRIQTTFSKLVKAGRKNALTLDHATEIARTLGASETSNRGLDLPGFMKLVVEDIELEKMMLKSGINPDKITNESHKTPRWERYLRRLYAMDAESSAFEKINESLSLPGNKRILDEAQRLGGWVSWESAVRNIIQSSIPQGDWESQKWAPQMLEDLFINSLTQGDAEPYESRNSNSTRPLYGWARAVWFFQYLDLKPAERDGYRKLLEASK